ncbi:MAG: 4-(cytidine 5'-diphospho)-2-C-methyl-D-erythritol kinase [Planctomycetota bacterium]|nr:4-(cytidine 5'-diphospho)-2-C-methyl-D-erythritol kinase [Planctomycetota bacterium]
MNRADGWLESAAPAKLNLFLEVTGKRPDGYHEIDSIFLEIPLADRLAARLDEPGRLTVRSGEPLPFSGDSNLVLRAARLLAGEAGSSRLPGLEFRLDKRIPIGGGLGGGSSDAASALRLANRLWGLDFPEAELARLGSRLGSDVPFFFHGGLCLCRGRGELVTPLPGRLPPGGLPLCLVVSNLHSSSAAAFGNLSPPGPGEIRGSEVFLRALAAGDLPALAAAAFNRFDAGVCQSFPALAALRRRLARELARGPWLSGSGSCLWFFDPGGEAASRLAGDPEWLELASRHGARLLPLGPAAIPPAGTA